MKTLVQNQSYVRARWARWLIVALLTIGSSFPAFAALGAIMDSVLKDQARMKASMTTTKTNLYVLHEMKSSTNTVVREYVAQDGKVFGIAWQGPFIPDMRQLLGIYFEQYSNAARIQRESHVGRQPLNIQEPNLVVQTAGHMRAFSGRAYDPALLPAGVSANDIR